MCPSPLLMVFFVIPLLESRECITNNSLLFALITILPALTHFQFSFSVTPPPNYPALPYSRFVADCLLVDRP